MTQGSEPEEKEIAAPRHFSLQDLAKALSEAIGQNVNQHNIRAVGESAQAASVADATTKFQVSLPDSTEAFAIVSDAINPDLTERASRNIALARSCLSQAAAAPVLPTIATGRVNGLSFALWPFRTALQNGGRLQRYVKRFRYAPGICDWHVDLVGETLFPADPEIYRQNLDTILKDSLFSEAIRQAAQRGQDRLRAGDGSPQHCLQHGDFWIGNILLPSSSDNARFFVIDWAGMNRAGYPFIDLCCMLMSLRSTKRFAVRQMNALRTRIGCDQSDVVVSVLSGLGKLGQNLEYFPPERYRQMAEDLFRFADHANR